MAQPLGSVSAGPGGWTHATPAEAGFAPDLEARLDKAVADKRVWNLHGLVVARHGRLVLERYWEGQDFAWGRDVGRVQRVGQRICNRACIAERRRHEVKACCPHAARMGPHFGGMAAVRAHSAEE